MDVEIFAVLDVKAELYRFPMFFGSTPQAIRTFTRMSNDPEGEIGQFPEDFVLASIGKLNEKTGVITVNPKGPMHIGTAKEFKKEAHNA